MVIPNLLAETQMLLHIGESLHLCGYEKDLYYYLAPQLQAQKNNLSQGQYMHENYLVDPWKTYKCHSNNLKFHAEKQFDPKIKHSSLCSLK